MLQNGRTPKTDREDTSSSYCSRSVAPEDKTVNNLKGKLSR